MLFVHRSSLANCLAQVRFVYDTFRMMQLGPLLLSLQGRQKQMTRLDMYQRFTSAKHAVMFATDIASRGLDFPGVDWVIQLDCPDDVETYVHRVGRTARLTQKGRSLLFLMPSEEEGMQRRLTNRGINVPRIKPKESKQTSVQGLLQSFAFKQPQIKFVAQRVRF